MDDTGSSPNAPMKSQVPDVETSLDNLENNFHMGSGIDFRPKLVNGKGPLDNFLRNRVKTNIDQTTVIIDLTEDLNDRPDTTVAHSKLNSAASPCAEAVNGVKEEAGDERGLPKASQKDELAFPEETLSDILCKAEEEGAGSGCAERSRDTQKDSAQTCPKLTDGSRICSKKDQDSWSKAEGILFRRKVPMVVLQDILAVKPHGTKSSLTTALDQGMLSESEMLESGPEEDSVLSNSSLSSSTSSPEGRSASKKHASPNPFPTSTPDRKVSIFSNPSMSVLMALLV